MTETTHELSNVLAWLAGGGAGWAASWLFDSIQARLRRPTAHEYHNPRHAWEQRLWRWFFAPRKAKIASHVVIAALGAIIAALASILLAWMQGGNVLAEIDNAIAGACAAIAAGAIRHGNGKLSDSVQFSEEE